MHCKRMNLTVFNLTIVDYITNISCIYVSGTHNGQSNYSTIQYSPIINYNRYRL